jgi:hypothetical protein
VTRERATKKFFEKFFRAEFPFSYSFSRDARITPRLASQTAFFRGAFARDSKKSLLFSKKIARAAKRRVVVVERDRRTYVVLSRRAKR